jgi:hypothetical protein
MMTVHTLLRPQGSSQEVAHFGQNAIRDLGTSQREGMHVSYYDVLVTYNGFIAVRSTRHAQQLL